MLNGKLIFNWLAGLAFAVVLLPAAADETAPDVLLKAVTLEVTALIRADKDIQAGNPAKVAELVETKILPLFNFTRMTQLAVAHHWRSATAAQQKTLTAEFKTLLVRTYSVALSSYRDQPIECRRLRAVAGRLCPTERRSLVRWTRAQAVIKVLTSLQVPGWTRCRALAFSRPA